MDTVIPEETDLAIFDHAPVAGISKYRPMGRHEAASLLHIIFDGPPGPEAGRFVEVETPDGYSVNAGEWHTRTDGYWELRIPLTERATLASQQSAVAEAVERERAATVAWLEGVADRLWSSAQGAKANAVFHAKEDIEQGSHIALRESSDGGGT